MNYQKNYESFLELLEKNPPNDFSKEDLKKSGIHVSRYTNGNEEITLNHTIKRLKWNSGGKDLSFSSALEESLYHLFVELRNNTEKEKAAQDKAKKDPSWLEGAKEKFDEWAKQKKVFASISGTVDLVLQSRIINILKEIPLEAWQQENYLESSQHSLYNVVKLKAKIPYSESFIEINKNGEVVLISDSRRIQVPNLVKKKIIDELDAIRTRMVAKDLLELSRKKTNPELLEETILNFERYLGIIKKND